MIRNHRILLVLAALPLIVACAPTRSTPGVTGGEQAQPRAPKVLRVAVLQEPTAFMATGGSQFKGGAGNVPPMAHETLVTENESGVWEPRLAVEAISIEKGTWRVNADGSMDTTWKLKPNVKWHDGTAFTSADVAFGFEVNRTPEFQSQTNATAARLMTSVETPDPYTVGIHWASGLTSANEGRALDPLPKHLLGDAFAQRVDTTSFSELPYFSTDFVGVGAYKLSRWEPGSFMELTAFDGYYRGRPPLDTIVVREWAPNEAAAERLEADLRLDVHAALRERGIWTTA